MAAITPDRFDPIKAYCNVRLQQGVPLVDADVNELDDIRKFEVRAFLKWFVGNGVPEGNDGFRITAGTVVNGTTSSTSQSDDFVILVGAQRPPGAVPDAPSPAANDFVLRGFGRCIVDGLDIIIQADKSYKGQTLSVVDLAPPYSLPPVAAIPDITGQVLVYLDVWERIVAPTEDDKLIVPPLGTESCARMKRQWVVRTRPGTSVPVPPDTDFITNHLYYGLAVINRRMDGANAQPIGPADITDLRERELSLAPSNLIPDVLGTTASAYRQGQDRPAISLRDAINAIAMGEVPALPEQPVTPIATGPFELLGQATLDSADKIIIPWAGGSSASFHVYVRELDPRNPSAGAVATPLTNSPKNSGSPSAITLPNGDIIIAYQLVSGNTSEVYFKRGKTVDELAGADPTTVLTAGNPQFPLPVSVGNIVVFFMLTESGSQYLRYNAGSNNWLDLNPVSLAGSGGYLHAAADAAGTVWVAFNTGTGMTVLPVSATTGSMGAPITYASDAGDFYHSPFVFCVGTKVTAFWSGDKGLSVARYDGSAWGPAGQVPFTVAFDRHPFAIADSTGRIALAYARVPPPTSPFLNGVFAFNLVLSRGGLGNDRLLPPSFATVSDFLDGLSLGYGLGPILVPAAGSLWLFWTRSQLTVGTGSRVYYRQLCSPL